MKKTKNKQEEYIKEIVKTSAKILSKDKKALKFLTYSFLFVDSLSGEYEKLRKMSAKERKKVIAKKWTLFKKEKRVEFNQARNRTLVDSVTKILGAEK